MFRKINDFDGDGKADFAITRDVGGVKTWYIWKTTAGFVAQQYGYDTDENVAADYDNDGKTDIAVFRKTLPVPGLMAYTFWIDGSQSGQRTMGWAYNAYLESVAHHQDYDGDGRADPAWTIDGGSRYFLMYNTGGTIGIQTPGGGLIKIGDTDGDGKAEAAGYAPNTNILSIRSSVTGTVSTLPFGLAGDEFVAADFDTDGKGDLAIWRPSTGTWWWMQSSDSTLRAAAFGTTGDIPVPADYDGDGKTDLAIWRSGPQSHYWVVGSQVGVFVVPWGISGDSAVRY